MKIEGSYRIEVARGDLAHHRTVSAPMRAEPGTVIASIDRFALSANNVTYAVHGADLGYWRAWPATDDAHGVVPVWGFATIAEGEADGIRPGMRFWGFWPSASHARLRPEAVSEAGFSDLSGRRGGMAPVYTRFTPAPVPARPDEEDWLVLFRPLFTTGFLIGRAIGRRASARAVVLTSASSKTALAAAWNLRRAGVAETIGLTSARHLAFVRSTGLFDAVLPYEDIGALPEAQPAVLVDIAGDLRLVGGIHARMRGLVESWIVGDTHRGPDEAGSLTLPGPARQLFFAPAVWAEEAAGPGAGALEAENGAALSAFLGEARAWFTVRRLEGPAGWGEAFRALIEGTANPAEGFVIIP